MSKGPTRIGRRRERPISKHIEAQVGSTSGHLKCIFLKARKKTGSSTSFLYLYMPTATDST